MKKYCLTDCFKRNISKKMEFTVELLTFLLIVFASVLIFIIISGALGAILQFATLSPTFNLFDKNPIGIGIMTILLTILAGLVLALAIQMIIGTYKILHGFTRNLVLNAVAPEQAECRIFEECKDV